MHLASGVTPGAEAWNRPCPRKFSSASAMMLRAELPVQRKSTLRTAVGSAAPGTAASARGRRRWPRDLAPAPQERPRRTRSRPGTRGHRSRCRHATAPRRRRRSPPRQLGLVVAIVQRSRDTADPELHGPPDLRPAARRGPRRRTPRSGLRLQDAERFAQDRVLVGRQVDHAVGDHDDPPTRPATESIRWCLRGTRRWSRRPCAGSRAPAPASPGQVEAVHLAGWTDACAESSTSMPPPEPRSSTIWPGSNPRAPTDCRIRATPPPRRPECPRFHRARRDWRKSGRHSRTRRARSSPSSRRTWRPRRISRGRRLRRRAHGDLHVYG